MNQSDLNGVFKQVVDHIQDGVIIFSPELETIGHNPKAEEWFPLLKSSEGKKCHEILSCSGTSCNRCCVKTVLEGGIAEHELFNSPLDNEENSYELSFIPIKDPDNGLVIAAAKIIKKRIQSDNTIEIEKAMKLLEREKQTFELLFHTLPYPMYMKDRKSRFTMVNEAMIEKLGFDHTEQMIGKTDFDIFTEDHARPAFEDEQEILVSGKPKIGYEEKETLKSNRVTYCLSTKMPVFNHDNNITGIVGISVDISDRKDAENQLEKNLTDIKLINKKLENYSFTISHDLKEPIRSIRTFSEFIMEDFGDQFDEEASDYFNRIIRASEKMALMIDDLLILSRVGRVDTDFKPASIKDIIVEVQDTLQQLIKETNSNIIIGELPKIVCQPVWIHAIFQNLINNSIKHSDKKKTEILIEYRDTPGYHEFSVKDNGRGIPRDQFEKVFQLFRKAHQDRNTKGSGAGLAIVSDVVDHHHGKIWIAWSELNKGTEIKFTIKKRTNDE